jgi:hypothetical protein
MTTRERRDEMCRQVRKIFSTSDNIDPFEYEDREHEGNFIFGLEHILTLLPTTLGKHWLVCNVVINILSHRLYIYSLGYTVHMYEHTCSRSSFLPAEDIRSTRQTPPPCPPVLNNAHDLHAQEQFHKKNGDDMSGEAGS